MAKADNVNGPGCEYLDQWFGQGLSCIQAGAYLPHQMCPRCRAKTERKTMNRERRDLYAARRTACDDCDARRKLEVENARLRELLLGALEFHGPANDCGGAEPSEDDCMWCVEARKLLEPSEGGR